MKSSQGAQLANTCKVLGTVGVLTDKNLAGGGFVMVLIHDSVLFGLAVCFDIMDEDLIGIRA